MLEPWGAPAEQVARAGDQLLACYREPHRRYHTPEHLGEVLAMLGDLVDLAREPAAVELAAWFHDAVYEPRAGPGVNEAASGEKAEAVLSALGVPATVTDDARRLIAMTATHGVEPDDIDAAVLSDADLWILAAPRARYVRYARDVRAEYGWLTDAAWVQGRSAVLAGFLDRPRLFATDRADAALAPGARANMTWELAALVGPDPEA
ncbi:MAG: hypothetical protein NVSMB12_03710 [Acidimicrobiales bacterium]